MSSGSIRSRVERLEAAAPMAGLEAIAEIVRVIVGARNPDGSEVVIIRRLAESGPGR